MTNIKEYAELRSCVKVEVAILGSPSLIVLRVSVDVKQHSAINHLHTPRFSPSLTNPLVSVDVKHHVYLSEESEPRSCVKVEVAVLGSPSLIVRTVSVDV